MTPLSLKVISFHYNRSSVRHGQITQHFKTNFFDIVNLKKRCKTAVIDIKRNIQNHMSNPNL